MDYNALLDLATGLGYELAMSGAETFRVEESISRVLSAYGIESEVFAIPNYLVVSIVDDHGVPITRMRRIGVHGNDLDAVEKFNGLSRAICSKTPDPSEALTWFDKIQEHRKFYDVPAQYLGYFLSAFGFGLFFNCNMTEGICAGICGLLVGFISRFFDKRKVNQFFRTITCAFFLALLAYAFGAVGIAQNSDAVTIGALMLLVPGLLFTNAMRDIIYGDTNSGINRIVQVLLIAAAIALGTATAWRAASSLWGVPISTGTASYPLLPQCLFSYIGCLGFAILFNIRGIGASLCALGGALSWAVCFLATEYTGSEIMGYFWSGLFASLYAEIMARIRKYPAISYLVISLFPMIPGAGVYYTMSHAVRGEMELFASRGMFTAATAAIIAVSILFGSSIFRMYSDWKAHKR